MKTINMFERQHRFGSFDVVFAYKGHKFIAWAQSTILVLLSYGLCLKLFRVFAGHWPWQGMDWYDHIFVLFISFLLVISCWYVRDCFYNRGQFMVMKYRRGIQQKPDNKGMGFLKFIYALCIAGAYLTKIELFIYEGFKDLYEFPK